MKKKNGIFGIIFALMIISIIPIASGQGGSSTQDASSLVVVSSVTMDPAVFYPYEQGTITITLTNSGNETVGLTNPAIMSDKIHIVNKDTFNTMSFIGSGSTMTYSFRVVADATDGTYFPLFTIGTQNSGSIHYPLIIKVQSKDITAGIVEQPEIFHSGTKESVNLSIVNPRDGELRNVLITPSGTGIEVTPSMQYIGVLAAQNSTIIPFTVTASQDSNLTFHISYENGDNDHSANVVLPICTGDDKTAAVPVVNNVALSPKGSYFDLTGDITNTGITDAKGLTVTVGSPAQGTETYPEYAIGSLASDDSGSFELTFTSTDLSSVPLIIHWKDSTGTNFAETKLLDLRTATGTGMSSSSAATGSSTGQANGYYVSSGSGMSAGGPPGMDGSGGPSGSSSMFGVSSKGGGISSFYPVIAGGIIVIAGIVLWKKRKWISGKLKR